MSFSTLITPTVAADFALQKLQAGTKPAGGGSREEKLRKYAGEFEADLLANLYKGMQNSLGGTSDDDPGADTLTDMGVHALATGLVAGGGIGIAKLLIQHLIPKGASGGAAKPQF
jgi:Rod binding domain-containing protein